MKCAVKQLLPLTLFLCCSRLIYGASRNRTVDFYGTVTAVRSETNGVYVTAVQFGSEFPCEIRLQKNGRCRNETSSAVTPLTITAGDIISPNWRGTPVCDYKERGIPLPEGRSKLLLYRNQISCPKSRPTCPSSTEPGCRTQRQPQKGPVKHTDSKTTEKQQQHRPQPADHFSKFPLHTYLCSVNSKMFLTIGVRYGIVSG